MNVIRHDDVTCQGEAVAVARFIEYFDKYILGASGSEKGKAPIATASDKVQVTESVAAMQTSRHGGRTETPALEGASRTGHPKCKMITQSEDAGVVFDCAAETNSVDRESPGHPPKKTQFLSIG